MTHGGTVRVDSRPWLIDSTLRRLPGRRRPVNRDKRVVEVRQGGVRGQVCVDNRRLVEMDTRGREEKIRRGGRSSDVPVRVFLSLVTFTVDRK